jgi:thiol-disulfide isomerase/thioredoxin
VTPLPPGSSAPPIRGVDFGAGPTVLFFYKVTCPVCQMAAPKARRFAEAYPGRIVGIGQDPRPKLDAFDREFGLGFQAISEPPPYGTSNDYGIRTVPTLFLVEPDGRVATTVESWDRDGYNRVSKSLAEATGSPFARISEHGDGLPALRPG